MLSTRHRAFTLVETLVVLAMLGILSAMLFPAFNAVRRRSYQTTCSSNLKQIGLAVSLYQQDYDGLFPRGGDPIDLKTNAWQDAANGIYEWEVGQLPPLTYVLFPYIKEKRVWRCPADIGFDIDDISGEPLDARPSSFEKFGMSYYYRTELTLKRKKELAGFTNATPPVEYGPSDINVLADQNGGWHGQNNPRNLRRYNVLLGDGHVTNMTRQQYVSAFSLKLEPPVLSN